MDCVTYLVLVRHGQSLWNAKNLFTGWENPGLTDKGRDEAKKAGRLLGERGIEVQACFTSMLARAQDTLDIMLEEMACSAPVEKSAALNERDYGKLTGKNKKKAEEEYGAEKIALWRRSYSVAPPGGESLEDTKKRVLPYAEDSIFPVLKEKNVLVAAHGNSLRALIMHLEGLTPEQVLTREIATGQPLVYEYDNGMFHAVG